jgi:hypothetical protein
MRLFTAGLTFVLLGSTLAAQGTRPSAPPATGRTRTAASSPSRKPAPAPNTVALFRFGVGTSFDDDTTIGSVVTQRARQAFADSERWRVLDRSADRLLSSELGRIQDPSQFWSEVPVNVSAGLNARYVLWGYVESVDVRENRRRGKASTFEATIRFSVSLNSVEQRSVLATQSFVVRTLSLRAEDAGSQLRSGLGSAIRGAIRGEKPSAERLADNTTAAATPQEAVERAAENVRAEVLTWATAQANALLGTPASEPAR